MLQKGQPYSIILTITREDGQYAYNESLAYRLGGLIDTRAVINANESFVYRKGSWEDYKKATEEDLQDAMKRYPGAEIWFDNFPIKGYSNRITGNVRDRASESGDHQSGSR